MTAFHKLVLKVTEETKIVISYLLSILFVLSISCTEQKVFITSETTSDNYKIVVMDELLKQPKYFHGQKIETSGILKYEFENIGLYKNKWSLWQNNSHQSFWLDFHDALIISGDEFENLNNKKITVKGILNVYDKGHLGKYPGNNISSCFCSRVKIKTLRLNFPLLHHTPQHSFL